MNKHSKNEKGFGAIEAVLVLVIIVAIAGVGWFVWQSKQTADKNLAPTNSASPAFKNDSKVKTTARSANPYAGWKTYTSTSGYSFNYPNNWVVTTQDSNNNYNVISGSGSGLSTIDLLYASPTTAGNNFDLSFSVLPAVTALGQNPSGATSTTKELSNGLIADTTQYPNSQPPSIDVNVFRSAADRSSIKLANGSYLRIYGTFMGGEGQDAQGSVAYKDTLTLLQQQSSEQLSEALSIISSAKFNYL